jgi:hypothetical protein
MVLANPKHLLFELAGTLYASLSLLNVTAKHTPIVTAKCHCYIVTAKYAPSTAGLVLSVTSRFPSHTVLVGLWLT